MSGIGHRDVSLAVPKVLEAAQVALAARPGTAWFLAGEEREWLQRRQDREQARRQAELARSGKAWGELHAPTAVDQAKMAPQPCCSPLQCLPSALPVVKEVRLERIFLHTVNAPLLLLCSALGQREDVVAQHRMAAHWRHHHEHRGVDAPAAGLRPLGRLQWPAEGAESRIQ